MTLLPQVAGARPPGRLAREARRPCTPSSWSRFTRRRLWVGQAEDEKVANTGTRSPNVRLVDSLEVGTANSFSGKSRSEQPHLRILPGA